jgi:tRNA(Arg) A34 adenosine deaminase TadA
MRKKIFNYFELAAQLAISKTDRRSFMLGAIGLRSDGVIVKALNAPTEAPNYKTHAEKRLVAKLNVGSIVYVARVRRDTGEFGLSKPCFSCMKAMKTAGVKKVYYTISQNEFGMIYLD